MSENFGKRLKGLGISALKMTGVAGLVLGSVLEKFSEVDATKKPAAADAERWKSQSWLLTHMNDLLGNETVSFDNVLNVAADPHIVLSVLNDSKAMASFVEDISNHELSSLVPYIKLFRVIREKGKTIEQELYFDTHLNNEQINAIFKKRTGRGGGVGIKNFTLNYVGVNPAEAKTIIESELEIYFSSIQELARKQSNNVAFIDLILPNIANAGAASQIKPKDYQLKAEFGWSLPKSNNPVFRGKKDLMNAIESNKLTIYLSMKRHAISFDQVGGATLKASYQGSMESIFSQEVSDILKLDTEKIFDNKRKKTATQLKADIKKLKSKKLKKIEAKKINRKKIKELREAYDQILDAKKTEKYQDLLRALFESGTVYVSNVPEEEFQASTIPSAIRNALGASGGLGSLVKGASKKKRGTKKIKATKKKVVKRKDSGFKKRQGVTKKLKDKLKSSGSQKKRLEDISTTVETPELKDGERKIYFVMLGDILRVVFNKLGKESKDFNFRLVTGDLEFDGQERNISNIPISLDLFQAWMLKYLVRTSRTKWFFRDFINELLTGLVAPVMNNIAVEADKGDKKNPIVSGPKKYKLFTSYINVRSSAKNRCVFTKSDKQYSKVIENKFDNKEVRSIRIASKKTDMLTYLYVHCIDSTRALRERNYVKDRQEGIYHFYFGSNRGILKSLNFEQENNPYFEVAQAQGKDLVKYKRIYNASIDTFFCNGFYPGNLLYLDTRSLGFSEDSNVDQAAMIGLGGYYRILGQSIVFSSGKLDMKMNCRWESSGLPFGKGKKSPVNKTTAVDRTKKTKPIKVKGKKVKEHKK
jgi:hypothetical protein